MKYNYAGHGGLRDKCVLTWVGVGGLSRMIGSVVVRKPLGREAVTGHEDSFPQEGGWQGEFPVINSHCAHCLKFKAGTSRHEDHSFLLFLAGTNHFLCTSKSLIRFSVRSNHFAGRHQVTHRQ